MPRLDGAQLRVMAIIQSYVRANEDGSLSSLNFRFARPERGPMPWSKIIDNWAGLTACRWECVKEGDPEQQKPDPPVRYLESIATPSRDNKEAIKSTSHQKPSPSASLSSLPTEIQLAIFRAVIDQSEPYVLRGTIRPLFAIEDGLNNNVAGERRRRREPRDYSIAFWDCRGWRDIPWFHLCRAAREEAIRVYGDPSSRSIPFWSSRDTIELSVFEQAGKHGSCRPLWHVQGAERDDVWAYPLSEERSGPDRCLLPATCRGRCPSDGLHRKRMNDVFATTDKVTVKLKPSFDVTIARYTCTTVWCDAWELIDRLCPRLKWLRLTSAATDLCGDGDQPAIVAAKKERAYRRENFIEPEAEQDAWQEDDIFPINGARRRLQDTNGQGLFPNVRTVEICLTESVCFADMLDSGDQRGQSSLGFRSEYFNTEYTPTRYFRQFDAL